MILYDNHLSRNGYKIRLLAAHLGLALERVEIDIVKGESRAEGFLGKNIAGRIPVLVLDDGTCLAESNAILFYLAQGSSLLPSEALAQAQLLRWMFFEQNMIEGSIGTARFWRKLGRDKQRPDAFAHRIEAATDALSVLERHLGQSAWLACGQFTIADIALYGYVSVAEGAGLDMALYPNIVQWRRNVASLPAHLEDSVAGETQ